MSQPVTYADVWEFWLRYSDLQNFVDFVTIHILPYWEDFPLPASLAAAHVDDIRKKVAAAIPNKEIMIGEVGWPSEGRMREGALPSPANQARVIEETVALAQRENFRVNVIEAFDQSWKRQLEGATGGYWGIFDRTTQGPKFSFDDGVSDHPHWLMQALAGIVLAAFGFAGAAVAGRGKTAPAWLWPRIAAMTFVPAVLFGWSLERIPIDSYTAGGWLRALAFAATAAAAPIACAAACAAGRRAPAFATLLSRSGGARDGLSLAVGITLIALTLLSVQSALGLVFDPRYRDIPFAPQSGAALPFLLLMLSTPRPAGTAGNGGNRRRRRTGIVGRLHCLQRNFCQLAGDLALRRISRPRRHSAAGAGRARLRINRPAASAESSGLCRTMPNPAAASDSDVNTIDGRIKLRSAATKATPPNTS